jgi:1-acyl-sn-glycerol-3-phosphate acyltransferase
MIFLRSALFNLVFILIGVVLTLAGTLARLVDPDRVLAVARLWARANLAALRVICGIRLEVSGREHLPPGAALIASNHQSAFDTMVWLTVVPRACYVLKLELLRIPLFGDLLTASGMIAVDREGGAAAIRRLLREGDRAVREARQIVIFPEGTRSPAGTVLPLQPGVAALAARTGLPVIPVVTDSGDCWGRRAFRKRPGLIRIVIRPPLPAGLPRDALMQRLRQTFMQAPQALCDPGDNSVGAAIKNLS